MSTLDEPTIYLLTYQQGVWTCRRGMRVQTRSKLEAKVRRRGDELAKREAIETNKPVIVRELLGGAAFDRTWTPDLARIDLDPIHRIARDWTPPAGEGGGES